MNRFRHGDVLLKGIAKLPDGLTKEQIQPLAYGEITGHTHRFTDGEYNFWKKGNTRYVEVLQPSIINHEEHGPLTILPGVYEQIQEREYSYEEDDIRTVVD